MSAKPCGLHCRNISHKVVYAVFSAPNTYSSPFIKFHVTVKAHSKNFSCDRNICSQASLVLYLLLFFLKIFLMWKNFKVFIEFCYFVTVLLLFYVLGFLFCFVLFGPEACGILALQHPALDCPRKTSLVLLEIEISMN